MACCKKSKGGVNNTIMIKDLLHQKIIKHYDQVQSWFKQKNHGRVFPFYASFDLRDSASKISPVDANLFPAGFNNICAVDKERATKLCSHYLKNHFPKAHSLILLAEEHTQNPFYWDNIYALKTLLEKSGPYKVDICVPGHKILQSFSVQSAQGHFMDIFLLKEKASQASIIISNNDFSVDYGLSSLLPITPPVSAGWQKRRKHSFFEKYNLLVEEFAHIIHIKPEILNIKTTRFKNFDPQNPLCLKSLKKEVAMFLSKLIPIYDKLFKGLTPFVFLKNNAGTYGLGMTVISSPNDIDNWNYKIRKKMKAGKGGNKVKELIIQEGIASHIKTEGAVAEPVIYMIGSNLTGGFLRTHKEKGRRDNLNSPGAVYRPLCMSDLEIEIEGRPMENVYGYIAHLSALALTDELKALKQLSL